MCSKVKKEFILCRNCPQRTQKKPSNVPNGYYYDILNGVQVLRECDCHVNWRKSLELEYAYEKANLMTEFTFNDYKGTKSLNDKKALESIANNFEKFSNRKMIYLYGTNGTQKTSMSFALGRALVEKGYKVYYLLMQELLNNLLPDFNQSDENKKAIITRYQEADFLIIDESFDRNKVTLYNSGYQIPFLDNFLRSRFDINRGSIMFVSNIKPEDISSQGFGDSLQNFIIRNTRNSFLIFEDKYIENANKIDRLALFS